MTTLFPKHGWGGVSGQRIRHFLLKIAPWKPNPIVKANSAPPAKAHRFCSLTSVGQEAKRPKTHLAPPNKNKRESALKFRPTRCNTPFAIKRWKFSLVDVPLLLLCVVSFKKSNNKSTRYDYILPTRCCFTVRSLIIRWCAQVPREADLEEENKKKLKGEDRAVGALLFVKVIKIGSDKSSVGKWMMEIV